MLSSSLFIKHYDVTAIYLELDIISSPERLEASKDRTGGLCDSTTVSDKVLELPQIWAPMGILDGETQLEFFFSIHTNSNQCFVDCNQVSSDSASGLLLWLE